MKAIGFWNDFLGFLLISALILIGITAELNAEVTAYDRLSSICSTCENLVGKKKRGSFHSIKIDQH